MDDWGAVQGTRHTECMGHMQEAAVAESVTPSGTHSMVPWKPANMFLVRVWCWGSPNTRS